MQAPDDALNTHTSPSAGRAAGAIGDLSWRKGSRQLPSHQPSHLTPRTVAGTDAAWISDKRDFPPGYACHPLEPDGSRPVSSRSATTVVLEHFFGSQVC